MRFGLSLVDGKFDNTLAHLSIVLWEEGEEGEEEGKLLLLMK